MARPERMTRDGEGRGGATHDAQVLALLRSAEDAVRRTEERFRALVQHGADAVVVCDETGRISYASPAFDRLFAWPAERLEAEGWAQFVLPEDHAAVRETLAELATRGPDEPLTTVLRVRHGADGWRWVEAISVNHLANPAVGGIVSNVRDVSMWIEAEQTRRERERLIEIFALTTDHVSTFDVSGHLV